MMPFSPFARPPHRPVRTLAWGAALAFGWAVATAAWAVDADRVIARVNGIDIKAGDLALADEDIGSNLPMTGDARRDYLTRYLIDMQLIVQGAEAKKLVIEREIFLHISGVVGDCRRHLRKGTWPHHDFVYKLHRHAIGIVHGEDAVIDLTRCGMEADLHPGSGRKRLASLRDHRPTRRLDIVDDGTDAVPADIGLRTIGRANRDGMLPLD